MFQATSCLQIAVVSNASITALQFVPDHRILYVGDESGVVTAVEIKEVSLELHAVHHPLSVVSRIHLHIKT